MAATCTATVQQRISLGGTRYVYLGTYALDNSYATGGDTIVSGANSVVALPEASKLDTFRGGSPGGYTTEFVKSSGKLKVYRQKDPAAAGGADIPLPEVANAADLSAVSAAVFEAIGS